MKAYEKFIARSEVEDIHQHTLDILENVGVKFENPVALEIFAGHGAKVSGDTVYLGEKMIHEALRTTPSQFTRYSGKGSYVVGGGSKITMPADGSIYISDNGMIRKMTNQDIINQFKMGETSPVINSNDVNGFLETQHFSKDQKVYANIAMTLKYSHTAPIALMSRTFELDKTESVRKATAKGLQIVKQFEGVEDQYVILYHLSTLSPLCYDHDAIERLLAHCDENQPLMISACAMPILTAPASVASMLAMTNAEILAGLTLTQLIRPGLPIVYGNTSGATNLKTISLSIGSPEAALVCYATAALADFYSLPFRAGGGLSDAKDLDVQCGSESMMMLYASLDANTDVIAHAIGIMGTFNVISFEKYLIDEELFAMCTRLLKGVDCSEDRFCMNEIREVGPRGTFLRGRTPRMYREEFFMPQYFDKQDPNQWQNTGAKSIKQVAQEHINQRLASYVPPEITSEQNQLLLPYIPAEYKERI
ncbi:trimethylamine methyltransferase [Desulfitobacterium hafniense DP7]|uniref:Trimethylamine methyltransferase n=1 Tax=Desulfitobacterium hafniense DP7 TaxID=537010 RepID=G9XGR3_DESHA|nr:trimethylamine methyltransferase family protein [Desulfitobacterium hafniense]EHL09098.1 trimethylamine methyltransferase [Desulfitobacterium hafniense DP7]